MTGEISIKKDSDVATRGDVREIVNEIVTEAIERFAIIVRRSFEHMDRRFDEMVTKAEFEPFKTATEQSLYELGADVTDLKSRMGSVEAKLGGIETRVGAVETRLADVEEKIDAVFGIMEIDGMNFDDDSDGGDRLWKDIERRWPKS